MHSILESDGVSSDPYEVLCYMGTLIVEGRTPRTAGEAAASGESAAKSAKPYSEGPHCPNFMKLHAKDTHNAHKCTENSVLCIRHSNLKQHLQGLHQKSPSISVEVSLGPDCLCGELRSQSTLVSSQPCKRDVVLEQWTITIGHKQRQEPSSQMSVMNLYQAVRSLLHFSQLTAWYMCNNGMRPSHVVYRVGLPEDSTFISDDNFLSHDFPVADVNKTTWMKISVKTLPRMEKIPTIFCPQHPSMMEPGQSQEGQKKEFFLKGERSGESNDLHSISDENPFPFRLVEVRSKTLDAQERKRKKHINLYKSRVESTWSAPSIELMNGMPFGMLKVAPLRDQEEEEYFFGKRMFQGESSKADYKKSKACPFPEAKSLEPFDCDRVEPGIDLIESFGDSGSDFRTKGKGKEGVEASPERRKSDANATANALMDILDDRMQISCAISGKHHCKWECEEETDLANSGGNVEKPKRRRSLSKARANECSDSEKVFHGKFREMESHESDLCLPLREQEADGAFAGSSTCSHRRPESPPKPKTIVDISNNSGGSQTPKIQRLPAPEEAGGSCSRTFWVRTESFESFRRGCAFARDAALEDSSDSEGELSDGHVNPFLAAILRTTRRSGTARKCDNSLTNADGPGPRGKTPLKVQSNLDLRKGPGDEPPEVPDRLKSPFDTQDLKSEACTDSSDGLEDLGEEMSSSGMSTKTIPVPSAHDKLKFRRSLDSAAQLVFHRCSGLPLTSSPAPVRRNNSSFSFDSSLNSVSAIKSALFEPSNSLSSEDENESEGSLKSPASPGAWSVASKQINYHSLSPLPLLGSFEESVLNGRLEPVSTVQGFTAELGASGSFCPRHMHLPVTVFFYTLGDNDKVSAPYLGHINLGKKGYSVPRSGTIQVTLFNPLRTVVKMFVVVYDLHDMPANSHTFLRQRTLYVPTSQRESTLTDKKETPFDQEDYHKYLRYLIHLRFVSGKSGRIYLHTDIRMVIFRKADEDTATALDDGETYELRSHTHGPINPKFSPRK